MRDKSVLSDRELHRKITDIIESMSNSTIRLDYTTRHDSYIRSMSAEDEKDHHNITIGRTGGVKQYTILNHELGHIVGETPVKWVKHIIESWVDNSPWCHHENRNNIENMYWDCYNILEDQRIEYIMGKLWLGNKLAFKQARTVLGSTFCFKDESPSYILMGIRFGRLLHTGSIVDDAVIALNNVEKTDYKGALICLARFKKHIDKYIEDNNDFLDEEILPKDRLDHKYLGGSCEYLKIRPNEEEVKTELGMQGSLGNLLKDNNIDPEKLSNALELSKNDGIEKINGLKDQLSNTSNDSSLVIGDESDNYDGTVGKPFKDISNGLNKLFKKINDLPKKRVDYDGDEVDIESYISNKASGSDLGRCMVDIKHVKGASIVLSVDSSGSMFGHFSRMDQVKDMVATMFDSIKGIDNINFRVVTWASDYYGKMKVMNIKSNDEAKNIIHDNKYYFTPTHLAVDYSSRILGSMKGENKLLIVITDGVAEYWYNGNSYDYDRLVKLGVKSVRNALMKNPNMMGLLVNGSRRSVEYCENVFGKRFINISNIDEGSDIILKAFSKLVKRSL